MDYKKVEGVAMQNNRADTSTTINDKSEEVVMQNNRAGNVDDISNSISSLFLDVGSCNDDVIVYEILSRLTVKALMRFKCVARRWQWLIENDPHFIKLHLTRSQKRPIFFYVIPFSNYWRDQKEDIRYRGYDELLLTTNLSCQGIGQNVLQVCTTRKTDLFCCDKFLTSSTGVICFINQYEHSVCIYNVSTREATPWIESTLLVEEQEKHPGFDISAGRMYSFGFDPTTMEHKVVCISRVLVEEYDRNGDGDHDDCFVVCEVMTVGENIWRRIDQVPPCYTYSYGESACVNGSIYWMTGFLDQGDWRKDLGHIVAFDIGCEKFRTISLPMCIVDKLLNPKRYVHAFDRFFVLNVGGCLAFLRRINPQFVKIRIFNEKCSLYNKEMGNKITISSGEKSWTEDTIKLPINWGKEEHRVEFYGVAGTDHIIIEFYEKSSRHMDSVSLYSYSFSEKSFMKIEARGVPAWIPEGCYTKLFTPILESIVPVGKKIARRTT